MTSANRAEMPQRIDDAVREHSDRDREDLRYRGIDHHDLGDRHSRSWAEQQERGSIGPMSSLMAQVRLGSN